LVDTLINQNAHFLRTGEQKSPCFLERSDSRFQRNGRKPGQELLERFSAFQVVKQGLDRHSCSAKGGSKNSRRRVPTKSFLHLTHYGPACPFFSGSEWTGVARGL